MLTFLLWFFGIILAINLVFRLFGRQLLALGVRQVAKRLMKDAENQTQAYRRHYEAEARRQNVYVDQEVTVSVPRQQQEPEVTEDEIVEDVEFEEIREPK